MEKKRRFKLLITVTKKGGIKSRLFFPRMTGLLLCLWGEGGGKKRYFHLSKVLCIGSDGKLMSVFLLIYFFFQIIEDAIAPSLSH